MNVVIVDDQPLMRSAFATILDAHGIEVAGEAGDGDEAIAVVRRTRPDVVLMDVRMPGRDGLAATSQLVAADPSVRVLILTTFDHDEYLDGALRAGAAGFLLKNSTPEELVRAVQRVAAGEHVLDPAVAGRVIARFAARHAPAASRRDIERLTEREKDVLALLARGHSNTEIAAALGVRRGHGQDPRLARAHEARRARPGAGGDRRLRDRVRPERSPHGAVRLRSPARSSKCMKSFSSSWR